MINKKWCDPRSISIRLRSCLAHLEHLSIICRQFYLPREFSSIIATAVYIPPQADHWQTPAWLCPNSTMCSVDTSTNTLTLSLSSQGTLTKSTSGRSCRTFISIYPVQLEDRIHWIIATLRLKRPTLPAHYWLLANRILPPFSSHRNINKGSFRNPQWREKWRAVLPLWSYVTGGSWCRLGEFIWHQLVHGCSIKLCQHANRASHWNCNYKDILQSETVGGQNNPWCG